MIVETSDMITLIGGGEMARTDLLQALTLAPVLVAADGAADRALEAGLKPVAVIGDFDSISASARATLAADTLHPIAEQETNDFDKCLSAIRAPLVLGLGFLGGRLDHQLAALSVLVRHPAQPCILVGAQDVAFLCPASLSLTLPLGTRLSLFPMGNVTGHSTGLRWPIDGLDFAPDAMIGTSNEVTDSNVVLEFDALRMVTILPRKHLSQAIQALTDAANRPDG